MSELPPEIAQKIREQRAIDELQAREADRRRAAELASGNRKARRAKAAKERRA